MPCKREARKRHNTIAFWVSDEEKEMVEAKIKISGMTKGDYYRAAILGQEIQIVAGRYRSERLANVLEEMNNKVEGSDMDTYEGMKTLLQELLKLLR